jgi:hypothetical protein
MELELENNASLALNFYLESNNNNNKTETKKITRG